VFARLDNAGMYTTRREAEADFCRAYHAAKASGWDPGP
jgi:hypothetical protein